MRWLKPLGNMCIPSVLFYIFYQIAGLAPAVIISLVYSLFSLVYSKCKNHEVKNSSVIGILGLICSSVMILFTGEEKLYYIPALVQNIVFLGFAVTLSLRRKSILHFLAKDFEIESLRQIPEADMLRINIVWILYFVLKILSKIIGILYLDFDTLYWVVFLLGDPMTIVVIVLSVVLIRRSYKHMP